jgi:apolipoprotein N-acyltransferase
MNPLHSRGSAPVRRLVGCAGLGLGALVLLGAGLRWLASEFGYQSNDANLPMILIFTALLLGLLALVPKRFWRRLSVRLIRSWRRR